MKTHMKTIYCTDGDADEIITGVGMTIESFTVPEDKPGIFGDLSRGYKRQVDVDPSRFDGLLSGADLIGYFTEAALAKPREGATVPLLVELIAVGNRHDVVVPPLFLNSVLSISGAAAPAALNLEEQHALFVRVLGKGWATRVVKHLAGLPANQAS